MSEIIEIPEDINRLSREILDTCFFIHTELGSGLLESVYEDCLFHFLCEKNIRAERQKLLPIQIKDFKLSKKPWGLLINFNVRSLKDGIKRIVMTKNMTKNFA